MDETGRLNKTGRRREPLEELFTQGTGMNQTKQTAIYQKAVVIFFILNTLGFPGQYTLILGESFQTLIEYGAFFLEIGVMLLSAGDELLDIRIVNLQTKYRVIYIFLAVVSVMSMLVTRFPKLELVSCLRFSVLAFFAIWIVDHFDECEILEMLYYAQILYLFFTLAFLVLRPDASFSMENGERSFTGFYTTKNPCGGEFSFCLAMDVVLYRIKKKREEALPPLFIPMLVVQAVLLVMCRATGAVFWGLVPVIYILFFEERLGRERRIPLGILYPAASVGFLVFSMTILQLFEPLLEAIGKDASLTGRIPMWREFINVMLENNTLTGFGWSMFWRDEQAVELFHSRFAKDSWGNVMTFGAHNTLLELWLEMGLIGIAVMFIMIIYSFRRIRELREEAYLLCSTYITILMLRGFTERSFTTNGYISLFLFISAALGTARDDPG